jgi:hypothetical protein
MAQDHQSRRRGLAGGGPAHPRPVLRRRQRDGDESAQREHHRRHGRRTVRPPHDERGRRERGPHPQGGGGPDGCPGGLLRPRRTDRAALLQGRPRFGCRGVLHHGHGRRPRGDDVLLVRSRREDRRQGLSPHRRHAHGPLRATLEHPRASRHASAPRSRERTTAGSNCSTCSPRTPARPRR